MNIVLGTPTGVIPKRLSKEKTLLMLAFINKLRFVYCLIGGTSLCRPLGEVERGSNRWAKNVNTAGSSIGIRNLRYSKYRGNNSSYNK